MAFEYSLDIVVIENQVDIGVRHTVKSKLTKRFDEEEEVVSGISKEE